MSKLNPKKEAYHAKQIVNLMSTIMNSDILTKCSGNVSVVHDSLCITIPLKDEKVVEELRALFSRWFPPVAVTNPIQGEYHGPANKSKVYPPGQSENTD